MIRETLSQKVIYTVEKHLMNTENEPAKTVMNRFMWIDDKTLRIVNRGGIEKIVDLEDGQKEVEFNVIPLFDNKEMTITKRHYYNNRSPLEIK